MSATDGHFATARDWSLSMVESTQTDIMSSVQAFAMVIIAVTCNKAQKNKQEKITLGGFAQPEIEVKWSDSQELSDELCDQLLKLKVFFSSQDICGPNLANHNSGNRIRDNSGMLCFRAFPLTVRGTRMQPVAAYAFHSFHPQSYTKTHANMHTHTTPTDI